MSLSKRSKKEFQEFLEKKPERIWANDSDAVVLERWFDSGEKSLNKKEMKLIVRWFEKKRDDMAYTNWMREYSTWCVIEEDNNGLELDLYPKFEKLLSCSEGIKLIEKILKEAEKSGI